MLSTGPSLPKAVELKEKPLWVVLPGWVGGLKENGIAEDGCAVGGLGAGGIAPVVVVVKFMDLLTMKGELNLICLYNFSGFIC